MWQLSESQAEGKLTPADSHSCTWLWEYIDGPWGEKTKKEEKKN